MTEEQQSIPVSLAWRVSHRPDYFFAFGLGSGLLPGAPGTWGTLAAIPFYLLFYSLPLSWYLTWLIIALVLGIYLCGRVSQHMGVHDHSGIVWDEFVGFWLTMAWVEMSWLNILLGFILFRIFDIWKPFPIGWLDKNLAGGAGIMLDDVLAGLYAGLCLFFWVQMTG